MARAPTVRKTDIDRVLKALADAGKEVGRVEIDPQSGKVIILTGTPEATLTPLERWRVERGRHAPQRA